MDNREEQIRLAEQLIATGIDGELKKAIENQFPELKESGDEKIRKELLKEIEFISPRDGETDGEGLILPSYHARIDRYKSYLEKQKDFDKAMSAIEKIDRYIDSHTANAHDMDDSNPDKKYYSGVDDTLSNIAGILNGVYSEEEQKEQKPVEDSGTAEPDYGICDDYLPAAIHVAMARHGWYACHVGEEEGFVLQRKKNAERNWPADKDNLTQAQSPVEWSEKDEKNIEKLDGFLSEVFCYGHVYVSQKDKEELQSWLKSLRPQPYWKPSEEQMKALEQAMDRNDKLGYLLRELHDKLKNL